MKKIHARQLILKKYSCFGLKKIHTRNLITKKKIPAAGKSPPPPPITFLMVRPLGSFISNRAFLSDTRQPEVAFLHPRAMGSNSRVNCIYKKNDT